MVCFINSGFTSFFCSCLSCLSTRLSKLTEWHFKPNLHNIGRFKILPFNCLGLNDKGRRVYVLFYLFFILKKDANHDISDTHFVKSLKRQICTTWDGSCIFYNCTSNSRGVHVCILPRRNLNVSVNVTEVDGIWNVLPVDFCYKEHNVNLVTIYGLNTDLPDFFENIYDRIGYETYIICVDFNLVLILTLIIVTTNPETVIVRPRKS